MAKPKFKSDLSKSIHASASALRKVGAINKTTMRRFDENCLGAVEELTAVEIKALREKNNLSQPVWALYLNTSDSTVEKWESGVNSPKGAALRLLNVVKKHGIEVLA